MPKSAKNGSVSFKGSTVQHATDIQVDDSVDEDVYASSSTGGQKSRLEGHADTSGQFTVIEKPSFNKGAQGALILKDDASQEIYNGGALITNIQRNVPIEDATRVTYTVTWGQMLEASSGNADTGVAS